MKKKDIALFLFFPLLCGLKFDFIEAKENNFSVEDYVSDSTNDNGTKLLPIATDKNLKSDDNSYDLYKSSDANTVAQKHVEEASKAPISVGNNADIRQTSKNVLEMIPKVGKHLVKHKRAKRYIGSVLKSPYFADKLILYPHKRKFGSVLSPYRVSSLYGGRNYDTSDFQENWSTYNPKDFDELRFLLSQWYGILETPIEAQFNNEMPEYDNSYHQIEKRHFSSLLKSPSFALGRRIKRDLGLIPKKESLETSKKSVETNHNHKTTSEVKSDINKRNLASVLDNTKRHVASVFDSTSYNGNIGTQPISSLNENKRNLPSILDSVSYNPNNKRHISSAFPNDGNKRHVSSVFDSRIYDVDNDENNITPLNKKDNEKRNLQSIVDSVNYKGFDKRHYSSLIDNNENKRHVASVFDSSAYNANNGKGPISPLIGYKRNLASILDSKEFENPNQHFSFPIHDYNEKRTFSSILDSPYYNKVAKNKKYFFSTLENQDDKRHVSSVFDSNMYGRTKNKFMMWPHYQNTEEKRALFSILDSPYYNKQNFKKNLVSQTPEIGNKRHVASVFDSAALGSKNGQLQDTENKRNLPSILDSQYYGAKRHMSSILDSNAYDDKRHVSSLYQTKRNLPSILDSEHYNGKRLFTMLPSAWSSKISRKDKISTKPYDKIESGLTMLKGKVNHANDIILSDTDDVFQIKRYLMSNEQNQSIDETGLDSERIGKNNQESGPARAKRYIGSLARNNNLPFQPLKPRYIYSMGLILLPDKIRSIYKKYRNNYIGDSLRNGITKNDFLRKISAFNTKPRTENDYFFGYLLDSPPFIDDFQVSQVLKKRYF